MKNVLKKMMVLVGVFCICMGLVVIFANAPAQAKTKLPIKKKITMTYSSGAGGWSTVLKVSPDGKFTGKYSDMDLGDTGKKYPKGTYYISQFSGDFIGIKKVNGYTYSMKIGKLKYKHKVGKTWIKNGIRYKATYANGLMDAGKFNFYTKKAPIKKLVEPFLEWNPRKNSSRKKLGCYGLHNLITQSGFFS